MTKKIEYNGRSYFIGTLGKYFYAKINGKWTALHRQKWEDHHGPIPKGHHVHHIDGNVFNNEIDNLACMDPASHYSYHWEKDKEKRMPSMLKLAEVGREYAKEWHGSHTGLKWHKQHYEKIKDKFHKIYDRKCYVCDKPINTNRKNGTCFCSGYCKLQYRNMLGIDNEKRNCSYCNSEFEVNKYRKVRFCSKSCAHKNYWNNKQILK